MDTATDGIKHGLTQLVVLKLLSDGELYGYQISKTLKEISDGILDHRLSVIYPILRKFEQDGYVSSYTKLVGVRRTRAYYRIEPAGRACLESAWEENERMFDVAEKIMGGAQ